MLQRTQTYTHTPVHRYQSFPKRRSACFHIPCSNCYLWTLLRRHGHMHPLKTSTPTSTRCTIHGPRGADPPHRRPPWRHPASQVISSSISPSVGSYRSSSLDPYSTPAPLSSPTVPSPSLPPTMMTRLRQFDVQSRTRAAIHNTRARGRSGRFCRGKVGCMAGNLVDVDLRN